MEDTREVQDLQDVMQDLELWLDGNTSLPRQEDIPALRWVDAGPVTVPTSTRFDTHGKKSRGFYDPDRRTIWLVRPWSPHDPLDVSVLLHELIHHRQTSAKHWYCAGAQELPAYRLQQAWLAEFGLEAKVNWIEVVLEAGCTPRDIHPD